MSTIVEFIMNDLKSLQNSLSENDNDDLPDDASFEEDNIDLPSTNNRTEIDQTLGSKVQYLGDKVLVKLSLVSWRWFNMVSSKINHMDVRIASETTLSFPGRWVNGKQTWSGPVPFARLSSKFSIINFNHITTLTIMFDSTIRSLVTKEEFLELTKDFRSGPKVHMIPVIKRKRASKTIECAAQGLFQYLPKLRVANLHFKRCFNDVGPMVINLLNPSIDTHITLLQDLYQLSKENLDVDLPPRDMWMDIPFVKSTTVLSQFDTFEDENMYFRFLQAHRPDNLVLSLNTTGSSNHALYQQLFMLDSIKNCTIKTDYVEMADLWIAMKTSNLETLNACILYHQTLHDSKFAHDNTNNAHTDDLFKQHTSEDPYYQGMNLEWITNTTPRYHYTNICQHIDGFFQSLSANTSLKELSLKNYSINNDNRAPSGLRPTLASPRSNHLSLGLSQVFLTNNTLTQLSLSGLIGITSAHFFISLENNESLHSLSLTDGTVLDDNDVLAALSRMLQKNKTLRHLSLSNNELRDNDGHIYQGLHLNSGLTSVDLSLNKFKRVDTRWLKGSQIKTDIVNNDDHHQKEYATKKQQQLQHQRHGSHLKRQVISVT
ncbi:hypothetical protein SAMD00019534_097820, partial [Acytostelium subglobosum LB1]|uniref:hypothetical protein n=1 Tax=Acytostelium subglobosum LB1 TaxID=1410327 RepID=UPI000644DAE6